ncbi:MAG TPA: alpha/beta hydrolase [Bacteroidales bacterium]|nr:hypothetical protein [Bacteroidales bacterium]HNR43133.1 alpha/beta hydrolase [Bacteroidales bacterium]HPM19168.1 alpha/beta hydrolase [Bacteroidales bacterium]
MKNFNKNRLKRKFLAIISVFLFLTGSCTREEIHYYDFYVSKEFKTSYTKQKIVSLLNLLPDEIPEIIALKQSVNYDVIIYKIVYNTQISGKTIRASGLLCLPGSEGEFPVVCFQNGTNTVNLWSPSESPNNPVIQIIEAVASMGYVVLIPDYPGFGESAGIPHPYLIAAPTIRSIIDMLFGAGEAIENEFPGISLKNEYYLLGYSQGGWATLNLHKSLEQDYSSKINLAGTVCGAGPYDLKKSFSDILASQTYGMPVYLGYIVYAYKAYGLVKNTMQEIFNEPYSSRIGTLFDGSHTSAQINEKLTFSIPELVNENLIEGFETSPDYSSLRQALEENSIQPWKTKIPLLFIHGGDDTSVEPLLTEMIYEKMILQGTSPEICKKEIIPGLDHGAAYIPFLLKGFTFLRNVKDNKISHWEN